MNNKRILIVDDDLETCLLLTMLFVKAGYETTVVHNGHEALEFSEQKKPDLIIFDMVLPDMDGLATYEQIRACNNIPAICLTALPSGENAARILKTGVMDYIRKPFYNDELLARVDALVNRPKICPDNPQASWIQMDESRPKVSVIIPTLNEARNLPLVLPYLPMEWVDEVIVVDGRSTDNTVETARNLMPAIKIVLEQKTGKGAALQAGYRAASGDIMIVLDADGSHDPREIPRYVTALMEGADFVKGSRFAPGGGTTDMPRYRQMGNGAFVLMTNVLFSASFTDLCYGYHAFWKYCLNLIDISEVNGFEIDTALYLGALQEKLRIIEVPSFEGYRFTGTGKLRTIPDGFRVLFTIAREGLRFLKSSAKTDYIGFRGQAHQYQPVRIESRLSAAQAQTGNCADA